MRYQAAKIIHNGVYYVYASDNIYTVVFTWHVPAEYGLKKKQKTLGSFPELSAALYNVYSYVKADHSPFQ